MHTQIHEENSENLNTLRPTKSYSSPSPSPRRGRKNTHGELISDREEFKFPHLKCDEAECFEVWMELNIQLLLP